MKAGAHIINTMVPPPVKVPRQAQRIGRVAALAQHGFAWAMTKVLRGLHRLDARLSRRSGHQASR